MEDEIELIDYLKVIWKRKMLIVAGTLLCVLAAGVKIYSMTPLYEASAKILITKPKYTIKSESNIETNLNQTESLKTYIEFFKSSKITDKVLKTLQLDKDPYNLTAGAIQESGELKQISGTDIIQLSVLFEEPKITADIANAWAKEFLLYNEDIYSRDTKDTKNLIGRQINDVRTELLKLEDQMKLNEEKRKIAFLAILNDKKTTLVGMEKKLAQSDLEKSKFKNSFKDRLSLIINNTFNSLVLRMNRNKNNLQSFNKKLFFVKKQINNYTSGVVKVKKGIDTGDNLNKYSFQVELTSPDADQSERFKFTTENPVFIKLQMEQASVKASIYSLQEEISLLKNYLPEFRQFLEFLKQIKLEDEKGTLELANEIETKLIFFSGLSERKKIEPLVSDLISYSQRKKEISFFRKSVGSLKRETKKMQLQYLANNLESERLKRIYDNKESTFSMLQKKYEELKLSASSMHSIGEIIEEATIPEFPSKPNKRKLLMIAFAVGMFLSIFIAFFTEYIQNAIAKQKA